MEIDKDKVIKREPIMLCSSCFEENCNGECWWIIKLYSWIFK